MKRILILAFIFFSIASYGQIIGPTNVCVNSYQYYTSPTASTYSWSVNGGYISGSSSSRTVQVRWTSTGSRSVTVNAATGGRIKPGFQDDDDSEGAEYDNEEMMEYEDLFAIYSLNVSVNSNVTSGSISGTHTICYGGDPNTIYNTGYPSGGGGYSYVWQYSNNGSNFYDIGGSNSSSYNPTGALYQSRWYRRKAISSAGCGVAYTSAVKVTVLSNINPGSITNTQTICYGGNPSTISNASYASGGVGLSYQWQVSSTNNTSGFGNISGATSSSYNPPTQYGTKWYRRKVTSGNGCGVKYSNVIQISSYNQLQAGSIGGSQTICYNGNPSTFSNSSSASGGTGIAYQWQKSTSSPSSGYSNISGATASTYNPPNLLQTTWYRRRVISGAGCGTLYSNVLSVNVYGNLSAGSISGTQTLCYGSDPSTITSSTNASGGTSISYLWEKSTSSSTSGFSAISGATSTSYNPPSITTTTWYRRKATSSSGCGVKYSNSIQVTIYNQLQAGSIAGGQSICYNGDPSSLSNNSSATGGTALAYQWQLSTTSSSSGFSNISGATASTYNPPNLLQTTWYRRRATSGSSCGTAYSNVLTVNVYDNLSAGSISGVQSLCNGSDPSTITSSAAASGGTGITYLWEKSTTSSSSGFSAISGATAATYNPPSLTATTWYRRKASSASGCGTSYTAAIKITIYQSLSSGDIAGGQMICSGGNPTLLTSTTAATGGTGINYQWQKSTAGATSGFGDIAGATAATYDPPTQTAPTWFRRAAISDAGCGTATTTAVFVDVNEPSAPVVSGDGHLGPGNVTLQAISGGADYAWYAVSTGGTSLYTGSSYTVNISNTTTYYVSSLLADGCEGSDRTAVMGEILPLPSINTNGSSTIEGAAGVDLSIGSYDSYSWRLDGQEVGTGTTFNAIHPGNYTVTITKFSSAFTTDAVAIGNDRELWAVKNGNWNDTNLWAFSENGTAVSTYPLAGDRVNIKGYQVLVNGEVHCNEVNVIVNNNNTTLTVSGSAASLLVNGYVNVSLDGANNPANSVQVINNGTLKCLE
jgi:hypothetical protein